MASPDYIVLSAADEFKHKTRRVHELWQTDFTYMKITGWGWYYLSTVLDDYSRYIIAWTLSTGMAATDVKDTLDLAVEKTGVTDARVRHDVVCLERRDRHEHAGAAQGCRSDNWSARV